MPSKKAFEIDLDFTKAQQRIEDGSKRFTVVKAGRRFGKSVYAICKAILFALNHPGVLVWYVGPYYGQVEEIAWDAMLSLLPKGSWYRKNESKLKIWLVNGSIIELKGADNENSLRGVGALRKLKFVVFEEAEWMKAHVWERIISPPLTDIGGGALFISSPDGGWFSRLYRDAAGKQAAGDTDWAAFKFTIYDNETISPAEIEKSRQRTSERNWKKEYLAEDSEYSGLVYPEFSESVHVVQPFTFPREWWQMRAIDWGERNPTACLWFAVQPDTGKVFVTQEYYEPGIRSVYRHAVRIKMLSNPPRDSVSITVIDPSSKRGVAVLGEGREDERTKGRPSSVFQDFINQGVPVVVADNRKSHGLELVRRFLEQRRGSTSLYFFSSLRNTLDEISKYEWVDGDDEGQGKEQPKKYHDHALDALRYGVSEIYRAGVARINPNSDRLGDSFESDTDDTKVNPTADIGHPHNRYFLQRQDEEMQNDISFETPSYL